MLTLEPSTNSTRSTFFFAPHGVAVIGASHDPIKLGHAIMCNLLDPKRGIPDQSIQSIPRWRKSLACAVTPTSVPCPIPSS